MDIQDYQIHPFTKLEKDWALLTAGTAEDFNSMTIAWGGMGTLWALPVVFLFVKPTRYTYEFVSKHDELTVSFYGDEYRKALGIFGTKSGRDIDKPKTAGLTPKTLEQGVTYAEATETIVCKKLFMQQLDKDKFPQEVLKHYEGRGEKEIPAHCFVVAEVLKIV